MKTVVVLLKFQTQMHYDWTPVLESSTFGEEHPHYKTADDFIKAVVALHKKHSYKFEVTNVIIE